MSSVRLPRRNLFRVFGGRAELLVGLLLATILEIRAAAAAEQAGAAPGQVPVDLAAIGVDPEAVRHFTPEQLKELLTPELLAKLGLAPEFAALIDSDFEGAIKKLEAAFREKLQAAGSEGRLAAVDGEVSDDDVDPQGDHALGLSSGLTPLLIIGGIAIAGGALVLALDDGDDEETVAEQAPVAANDSFTTNEDAAVTINVRGNDTDVNGDTLTVTQVNGTAITGQNSVNVTGGVVTLVNGNLVFTPNANYNGTPSFTYTVSDGKGGTSTATVSGTVTPVNDAPVNAVPAAPVAAVQGVAVAIGGLSVADVDGAGNFTVTLSVGSGALTAGAVAGGATVAGSGTGTVTLTGTLAQVNASLGGISFNGGPAFNGATTLTMTTSDGQATDTDSFAINVTRVASGIVQDGYVRGATVFIDVNGNGALDAGEPSAVTDANGNFSIASNAVGSIVALGGTNIDTGLPNTVVLKAPAGSTVINPITTLVAAVVEGGASLEAAKAIVNQALGIPANVDVTSFDFLAPASTPEQAQLALDVQKTATQIVTLINNAAEAAGGGAAGEAIKAAVLDSLASSVETGAPVDLTKLETVQTILATVPNLPPAAAQAAANTTAAINQAIESATSAGGIAQTVVQLEAPGADLPPVTVTDTVNLAEDGAAVTFNVLANDVDPEGGSLALTAINGTAVQVGDTVQVTGGTILVGQNGALTFQPGANFNGTPTFAYTVADPGGKTQNGTVQLNITPVNDAPVAGNDSFTTDIHAPVTIDVRANDGDADGNSLTVTEVNGRPVSTTVAVAIDGGSVILDASGNLVFTPADGYVGAPSFSYTVSDASGATAVGTVTGDVQLPGSEISVTPAQLTGVIANAAALTGAGLEQLSVVGGSASLTAEQALQLEAANLDIIDSVDLTLNVSQSGVDQFAADPSALNYLDVDHLDMVGDAATITDLQASALVDAGVDFADGDTVTLDAASGTHLSTSLKDLQTLHVDAVLVTGAGLTIDAGGSLESLTADSLPSFSGGAGAGAVTLNLDGAPIDPGLDVAPIAAALAAAGIDQLSATGASLTMTDEQAASFLAAGIGVQDSTDFTLAASSVELDTVLANTALLAGFGVDHIDLTDNSITLTEDQAAGMVAAGVDFADGDTVTLSAGGTQLSTSLKDLQTLHVDAVLVTGSQISVDAGGTLDTLTADSLPVFESAGDTDVTINVDSGTLDPSFDLGSLASAFHTAGIDHIGVIGDGSLGLTGAQALALGDHGIGFDAGADVTVSLSGAELTQLTPLIGDLNIDHLDMAGDTALISDSDAVALVDAGVDFATGDMVTVEAQGTHLSSTLKGLHDLNVDTIRVEAGVSALHLDAGDLAGISADDLPQFDIDQSDTSLDVTLRVDAAALGEVERLAAALRAAGVDHFAVDQPIASYDAATQAQMQAIADASGIDFVFEERPANFASTTMVSSIVADQQADPSLYRELLSSFEAHDDLGTGGEFVLVDGTVHSLFEAGMLRAYTADSLVVDATGGDDLILTSLRDIADMGVTHVLLPEFQDSPVYVDIGAMLPGNELDEVRHLFEALEERAAPGGLFEGNEKIALVVDSDVAHALSQVEGALDKLATLGFTELDVLLTNGAAAPFEASTAMEVKLIGQDDDLYRHLHHDR